MITSSQNPKIQRIIQLQQHSRERKLHNAFIVDGVRLIEEAVQAKWEIEYLFFSSNLSERGLKLIEVLTGKSIVTEEIPLSLMKKVSETENPQGIIAVVKQNQLPLPNHLDFILICDGINDPGNLGTILRSADAARTQLVLVTSNSVDIFNPKVVRSGMGAHFHLPIYQLNWAKINLILNKTPIPIKTLVASADANLSCWDIDLTQPIALVVGNEAHGPGEEAYQSADQLIKIPMPGKSESLNAAIATGILLFETVRQRQK